MRSRAIVCLISAISCVATLACRSRQEATPPVATPSLEISNSRVPLGSPAEITYRFEVAPTAPPFAKDYRVMVHVVDSDEELMWTDDHNPPTPTRQWKPGQVIEYTRTVFFPVYPYLGTATLQMGLYAPDADERLSLNGEDAGQRAYRVGTVELLPQTENIFVIFKDGWHSTENAENSTIEWQWTKKDATLAMRNPKRDVLVYLHVDHPGNIMTEAQHVTVTLQDQQIDEFRLERGIELIRKVPLTAAQLGSGETIEIGIHVDKTFVPSELSPRKTNDRRELGIRVFHAFVQPK